LTLGCGTKAHQGESLEKAAKEAEESLHNHKLLNRKSTHSTILSSIMATMFERSQETEEHAMRLSRLSKAIGEKLNLPQKSLAELELFSMLHDIGKVGIDDRILNKPDKLNGEEWAVMKKHPEIGYRIAMSSPELEPIAEYILSHHERWDGTGYPQRRKGEDIPLLSRILAVADAYDAMTEDRVYRKALTKDEALEEIKNNAGTQFDPLIAKKFIESMK
jgi:HD-GYP domain-containing protein (c-di-GMP phosphodiesterase class II)